MAAGWTTTSSAEETIYEKILSDALIDHMYSVQVMDALVRQESLVGRPSDTFSFPIWPGLTAASVAETADIAHTQVDTDDVEIAVAESAVIRIDVTDRLSEDTIVADGLRFAEQGAKAVSDKRDADLAALLSGFTETEGAANAALEEDDLLDAMTVLRMNDAPLPFVMVVSPQAVGDLRKALLASQASVLTNRNDPEFAPKNGLEFSYSGIPIYSTTNTPVVSGSPNAHGGAMFSFRNALARVDKRPIRLRPQRDESRRVTEYVITSVYGQGELVDDWGVTLLSEIA